MSPPSNRCDRSWAKQDLSCARSPTAPQLPPQLPNDLRPAHHRMEYAGLGGARGAKCAPQRCRACRQGDHSLGFVGRGACGDGIESRCRRLHHQTLFAAGSGCEGVRGAACACATGRSSALCCDELVLDASTHCVMAQGKLIHLRGTEYRLLEFLMSHSGRTFNRSQLLYHVWGTTPKSTSARSMSAYKDCGRY